MQIPLVHVQSAKSAFVYDVKMKQLISCRTVIDYLQNSTQLKALKGFGNKMSD